MKFFAGLLNVIQYCLTLWGLIILVIVVLVALALTLT